MTPLDMRRAAAREYYATCTAYADGLEHKSDTNYSYAVAFVSRYVAAPMALLEIGCGTGRLAEIIATTTGCSITATDLSPHFIEVAGRNRTTNQVVCEEADVMQLPYADGAFDAVYTYQAVEHFPDPMGGLREMARVTRPGGMILIITPNLLSPVAPLRLLALCLLRRRGFSLSSRDGGRNVAWTCIMEVGVRAVFLLRHTLSRGVLFFPRLEPDYTRPGHGDTDATWRCNTLDMRRLLSSLGCSFVEACGARTRWLGPLAGSIHLAMRRDPRPAPPTHLP